jgi:hypothetical protein
MLIDIPATMTRTRNSIAALGGDVVVFDVGPPATETQLRDIEQRIGCVIPATLRRVFREQCACMKMFWTVEDARRLSKLLGDGLAGGIDLSLQDLPVDLLNWSGWRAAFESPAEHGSNDFNFVILSDSLEDFLKFVDPARLHWSRVVGTGAISRSGYVQAVTIDATVRSVAESVDLGV